MAQDPKHAGPTHGGGESGVQQPEIRYTSRIGNDRFAIQDQVLGR
jgi:hypothetical protein